MSLKALASETLARLRAGEMGHETKKETELKQVKQDDPCFTGAGAGFTPMKHDERQKAAKNEACFTVSLPRGETHETSLPDSVVAGLARLRTAPVPKGVRTGPWAAAVSDALRLAEGGWAGRALALGWTELALFGAVTDPEGDPEADGLAVKLGGRRVLAICESFATVADATGGRSCLHRGDTSGLRLLWNLRP